MAHVTQPRDEASGRFVAEREGGGQRGAESGMLLALARLARAPQGVRERAVLELERELGWVLARLTQAAHGLEHKRLDVVFADDDSDSEAEISAAAVVEKTALAVLRLKEAMFDYAVLQRELLRIGTRLVELARESGSVERCVGWQAALEKYEREYADDYERAAAAVPAEVASE